MRKEYLAKGKYGLIGNKGCVAYQFQLRDRVLNFICCHLKHGQDNSEKRIKESQQIIRDVFQPKGPECDSTADLTIFFGDLNYRTNATFEQLSVDIQLATNPKLDQLALAMK